MSASEAQLRAEIVEVGRRLYARGYTASNDGNISVRLDAGRLLMTPTSVCKGFMTPEMMCITDLEGRKLSGDRGPSSEMQMHLEVYRQRPDAQAVVHAHPPTATGFAVAGMALPEAVRKYVKAHDGMLLANHGALTLGKDLFGAYYKMETIEHFAHISLVARMLGGERLLTQQEVDRLQGLRDHYGITSPAPICAEPSNQEQAECQIVEAPAVAGRQLVTSERLAAVRRSTADRP